MTVDLLTTGVDIPDLEFIVFLRPVKSRILFEQMLGRGTRKGEKYPDKSHFAVFDCFDGTLLEYFRNATGITAEPPESRRARRIGQIIEDIWQNRDRDYNIRCLVKRLQRIDKEMSGEARELFAAFIADGDLGAFADELPRLLRESTSPATMKTAARRRLPGPAVELPAAAADVRRRARASRTTVASEWLIRGADGKEYKPEDYLDAFATFVREQRRRRSRRSAILLARPAGLEHRRARASCARRSTQAPSTSPRTTCSGRIEAALPQGAGRHHLDGQARRRRDRAAADRRGAGRRRPSSEVTAGRELTDEQQQWLERIRQHLVAEPLDRPRRLRRRARPRPTAAAGAAPTASSTASSPTCSADLNEELVAA